MLTAASQVRTTVNPSISVLIGDGFGRKSVRSLSRYKSGWLAGTDPLPLLILLMVTGVPSLNLAQLTPLTKKAKTSLKLLPTYSLYSSEAKTYWNETLLLLGTKSNSSTAA